MRILDSGIKKQITETVYIRPVKMSFISGADKSGALVVDGRMKSYVYPIDKKPDNSLEFLSEILHKENMIVRDILRRSYQEKKNISLIDFGVICWDEYESIFSKEEYYSPPIQAEIICMEAIKYAC